jgi:ketosteroid isomerase-like protein
VSEPVEVVRAAMAALAADGVDGMVEYIHPEFVMSTPAEIAAEPDTYRGHEGVRRWFESFYEVMDRVDLEAADLEPAGEFAVAGTMTIRARGATTGIETTLETQVVCEVAEGKISAMRFFPSRGAALEAG